MTLDSVDGRIVQALAADARQPVASLARELGLSAPSTAERIRRLEDMGVIRGYRAEIDPQALGLPIAAWLRIKPVPGALKTVVGVLQNIDAIVSCDRITGEDCFIARAHVASVQELEALIDRILPHASTNTSIIQSAPVPARLPAFSTTPMARRRAGGQDG